MMMTTKMKMKMPGKTLGKLTLMNSAQSTREGSFRMREGAFQCLESLEIIRALNGNLRTGMCCCPCHDDRTPSLHVSTSNDGRTLLHCHAGCSQAALVAWCKARGL
jgi:hypothetical protein